MAVEFKKLSAEWTKCETRMTNAWGELDSAAQTEKNSKDLLEGAREDIVEQVFAAKKGGTAGAVLADFMAVKGVKSAWTNIQSIFVTLKAAHNRYEAGILTFKSIFTEATKISDTAKAEVAARKKKIFDSKSIPDLEKLAKEIDDRLKLGSQKHMRSIKDFSTQKPSNFTFDKTTEDRINKDIKGGINSIKVDADDSTVLREFAIRHLSVVLDGLNKMAKTATAHCVNALKAMKAQDKPGATDALDKAIKVADGAQKISEKYAVGVKKHGNEIKDHKDGKAMLERVNKINKTVSAILSQISKTQTAIG